MKTVLCDIEGTVSSIAFVHEVLFPLSYEKMDSFLKDNRGSVELKDDFKTFMQELVQNGKAENENDWQSAAKELKTCIKQDQKHTFLKLVQGKIWKSEFESGKLKSHIYPDVLPVFESWKKRQISIYIYSSGSVEAQKLYFGHTEAGDLRPYLSGYFDTTTGPKKETLSYRKIAGKIGENPQDILFLSDVVEELDHALEAGFQTMLVERDEKKTGNGHTVVRNFEQIVF